MKYIIAATLVTAAALGSAVPAQAQALAYASHSITMRAGPDASYPPVAIVPPGMQVSVQGCLSGYQWCDVVAGNSRGWVWSGNLNYPYQGRYVALPSVAGLVGLGILSFALNDYWGEHYRSRPFYSERYRYMEHAPRIGYAPSNRYDRRSYATAPRYEQRHDTRVMGGPPSVQRTQPSGSGGSGWSPGHAPGDSGARANAGGHAAGHAGAHAGGGRDREHDKR